MNKKISQCPKRMLNKKLLLNTQPHDALPRVGKCLFVAKVNIKTPNYPPPIAKFC